MMGSQFDRCLGWIEPALRRGAQVAMSIQSLETEIVSGRAQLWPGEQSAMVTRLFQTPSGGCLHVWLGGGKLAELLAMRPGIEAWGRAQGCTHVTISGRNGWRRALRAFGYRAAGDELLKDLVDGR